MKDLKQNISTSFLVLSIAFLGACTAAPEANIRISIVPGKSTSVNINDVSANPNPSIHPGEGEYLTDPITAVMYPTSETGLLKTGGCYLVHVSGPGLENPNHPQPGGGSSNTCPAGVPDVTSLGILPPKVYPYGGDVSVKVPSGPDRRIDLIGFINPYPNDTKCEKPFRIEFYQKADGQGGTKIENRFIYGNYVVDTDSASTDPIPAGLQSSPNSKFGFFATSGKKNLGPGPQNVELVSLPWSKNDDDLFEGPNEYGCGDGGGGSNGGPPSHGFEDSMPHIGHEGNIYTGMFQEGFLQIACEGTEDIDLVMGGISLSLTCSGSTDRANFQNIVWNPEWNSSNTLCVKGQNGYQPGDTCVPGTNSYFGQAIPYNISRTTGDSISGHILYSPRYMEVRNNTHSGGALLSYSGLGSPSFVGYKRSGDSRSIIIKDQSAAVSSILKTVIQPQNNDMDRSSFDWDNTAPIVELLTNAPPSFHTVTLGLVDANGARNFNLFGVGPTSGTNVIGMDWLSPSNNYYTSLIDGASWSMPQMVSENGTFVSSSVNPALTTPSPLAGLLPDSGGLINSPGHGLFDGQMVDISAPTAGTCTNGGAQTNARVRVINPSDFEVYSPSGLIMDGGGSCTFGIANRSNINLKAFRASNLDIATTAPSIFDIPMVKIAGAGVETILLDMPPSGNSLAVALRNSTGMISATQCESNNSCLAPTLADKSATTIDSADLIMDQGQPLLLAASLNSLGTVKRYQFDFTNSNPQNRIQDNASSVFFYPNLPAGVFSNVIIKSLRSPDNFSISRPEALLYFENSGTGYLYRSLDAGLNWYRVDEFPSTSYSVTDITVVENNYGSNWEPAFALLVYDTTAAAKYIIRYQDGAGF